MEVLNEFIEYLNYFWAVLVSREGNEHLARTWELSTFIYICEMEAVVLLVVRQVVDVLISLKFIFFKRHLVFP